MATPKARILYTEDDPDLRDLVSILLTGCGCEVVATDSKQHALAIARNGRFDLYLLDNWLRDDSGIDLCKQLRLFDGVTPILFYSGAAYQADKECALNNGAQLYLTKPIDNDVLVNAVFRLIDASPARAGYKLMHRAAGL